MFEYQRIEVILLSLSRNRYIKCSIKLRVTSKQGLSGSILNAVSPRPRTTPVELLKALQ